MTKKDLEKFINDATDDEEQALWEKKKLGADARFIKRSEFYKAPSKLISIRVPEEVLEELKAIAGKEGLRYQTYIISLLKKHVRRKKAG
jgi:predicted DNA binding CopG/RHH family protein